MKITLTNKSINYIAVFMTLLYAFTTRSVVARFIFGTQVQLLCFYGITYICLILNFINAFDREERHLYAPNGFYRIFALFLVIAYGLLVTGDIYSLIYYGMALLLPFSITDNFKSNKFSIKCFAGMAMFFSIGCFLNFLLPSVYRNYLLPLFSAAAQQSLMGIEKISGGSTYFAGFTSQVGYTSFFISLGVGAVFCFKDTIFKRCTYPLLVVLFAGLLLTGKRGPLVFLFIALAAIFFLDGRGREKVIRVLKIAAVLVGAYIALMVIANATQIPGITRIFEAVNEFMTSGSVEDEGRSQLRQQALLYFKQNPLFGIGWTNFRRLYSFRSTHVHCIYIQLLCETGICGFLIFISFFVREFVGTIKKWRRSKAFSNAMENDWMKFSVFMQLYFLLYGITGNPLYDIEETIFYFFAIGVSYLPLLNRS